MIGFLRPSATLSPREVQRSLRLMSWDSVLAGAMFSLGSGGFMAAYALALGANNLQVGILAALPPVSQVVQMPAILLVEKFRRRKAIGLPAWFLSQLMWVPIAAVPFLIEIPGALAISAVIMFLALRGLFTSVWVTAQTSWMRDLVSPEILGRFYSTRMALMTVAVVLVGLGGSFFVSWWQGFAPPEQSVYAYSFLMLGGWLIFGLAGPLLVAFSREPLMPSVADSNRSAMDVILDPLRDANFRSLLRFLLFWNFALNLAVPFFAVYMFTRLGFSLPMVIGFTMLSQVTNVLFVRVWGTMADRYGIKTVLSLSASLYLLVIIGWVFTTSPGRHLLSVPLLVVLHAFAGVAAAGVFLTIQTIAVKAAPAGRATPYISIAGVATGLGSGVGPVVGGALADLFADHLFRVDLSWTSSGGVFQFPALTLTGIDFLFVISFALGAASLNLLTRLREEGSADREVAMRELMVGMSPVLRAVSSVPGVTALSGASYGYIRRVPGAEVALGVMAYELASATQAAVTSAGRGRQLAADAESLVGRALGAAINRVGDAGQHGVELARHATRGALHVGDELADQLEGVVQSSMTGSLRALNRAAVDPLQSLYGAGYGAVQGALESGNDPGRVARAAVDAARSMAGEMGLSEDEAAAAVTDGIFNAASDTGAEILDSVREALPDESGNSKTD